jgi:hypothetical protein
VTASDDESFLQRWMRRKGEAATDEAEERPAVEPEPPPVIGEAAAEGEVPVEGAPQEPAGPITDADLPELSELDEDSDYSLFMAAGVSPEKRKAALRQLFRSPKFNVIDGLDDYCEDFRNFDPLGSIVTAEMRYQAERLARKALEGEGADATVAEASDAASGDPSPEPIPSAPDQAPEADADGPAEATAERQDPEQGSPNKNV